jgi:HlyD family secretion protein
MDIARPDLSRERRRRRIVVGGVGAIVLLGLIVGLARLRPAAPAVDRALVWIDTVKQGPMIRQVRGLGTLVPEEIRWVAARTPGRVESIVVYPGTAVEPESVLLILSNPAVEQAAAGAESQLKAAETELLNLEVQLRSGVLASESAAASAQASLEASKLRAEVYEELFQEGLVSSLEMRLAKVNARHSAALNAIEIKRFAYAQDSIAPQLAVKAAEVERLRTEAHLRRADVEALTVKAGMRGVLQLLPVEVGAQVPSGTNLARVANPARLKAQILIAEIQAKEIQLGQLAQIDTRSGKQGLIEGKVVRVDPSVQNGTITVDIGLTGTLPLGARPDLSVDGIIELERLDNVVHVGRPSFGQESGAVDFFLLEPDGVHASRKRVQLGRSSVASIEILTGLQPGDRVILSDMSASSSHLRIRLAE